jgi:hypothetical protein
MAQDVLNHSMQSEYMEIVDAIAKESVLDEHQFFEVKRRIGPSDASVMKRKDTVDTQFEQSESSNTVAADLGEMDVDERELNAVHEEADVHNIKEAAKAMTSLGNQATVAATNTEDPKPTNKVHQSTQQQEKEPTEESETRVAKRKEEFINDPPTKKQMRPNLLW